MKTTFGRNRSPMFAFSLSTRLRISVVVFVELAAAQRVSGRNACRCTGAAARSQAAAPMPYCRAIATRTTSSGEII